MFIHIGKWIRLKTSIEDGIGLYDKVHFFRILATITWYQLIVSGIGKNGMICIKAPIGNWEQ